MNYMIIYVINVIIVFVIGYAIIIDSLIYFMNDDEKKSQTETKSKGKINMNGVFNKVTYLYMLLYKTVKLCSEKENQKKKKEKQR